MLEYRLSAVWLALPLLPLALLVIPSCGAPVAATPKATQEATTSPPRAAIVRGDVGAHIDKCLSGLVAYGFSGSVLVAKDGEIALHKGYGLADRKRATPVRADTVFDIGSITKTFTAVAIMKLEMQGKLSTGDPITKYFADVPPDKAGITLHHLLTHTAGLQTYSGDDYARAPRDSTIRRILGQELRFPPGQSYAYSNNGYSVLAAIIELVSGKPYEELIAQDLLEPAGITQTGYVRPAWSRASIAHGYAGERDSGTPLDQTWSPDGPYWNLFGNGGFLSTTGDLYRWHLALQGNTLLDAATKRKMYAPPVLATGRPSGYAYGWRVEKNAAGATMIGHGGGADYGFTARFVRFVDDDIVVALTTNRDTLDMWRNLPELIHGFLLGGELAVPPSVPDRAIESSALKAFEGAYELPGGAALIVEQKAGHLTVSTRGQDAVDLFIASRAEDKAMLRDASLRTEAMIRGIAGGDFAPARAAFGEGAPEQPLAERWSAFTSELGDFQDVEILGTAPSWFYSGSHTATWMKLRFARGEQLGRVHWSAEGTYAGLGGGALPFPITLQCRMDSPSACRAFHMGLNLPPSQIRFDMSEPGEAQGLTVVAADGKVVATLRKMR